MPAFLQNSFGSRKVFPSGGTKPELTDCFLKRSGSPRRTGGQREKIRLGMDHEAKLEFGEKTSQDTAALERTFAANVAVGAKFIDIDIEYASKGILQAAPMELDIGGIVMEKRKHLPYIWLHLRCLAALRNCLIHRAAHMKHRLGNLSGYRESTASRGGSVYGVKDRYASKSELGWQTPQSGAQTAKAILHIKYDKVNEKTQKNRT